MNSVTDEKGKSLFRDLQEFFRKDLLYSWTDSITENVIGDHLFSLMRQLCSSLNDFLDPNVLSVHPQSDEMHIEIENCLTCCEALLDRTWEHLNIGNWKDVKLDWRYLFGYLSFFKTLFLSLTLDSSSDCLPLLKACDLGLLMSPPLPNNVTAKIATRIHKFQIRNRCPTLSEDVSSQKRRRVELPLIRKAHEIKRISLPDLIAFESEYFRKNEPVIIEDAIDHWPALDSESPHKWSIDYILQICAYRTVPVEIGSRYTDETWSQKLMTIEEFMRRFIENGDEVGYVAQHQLFEQIEELRQDFSIPDYCGISENAEDSSIDVNAWFGPLGTVSPLHHDPNSNLFTQVVGSKYVRLYSSSIPEEQMYPFPSHLLTNTSEVDVQKVDLEKFPLFPLNQYSECILNEGEMLFIPKRYWHFVKSLSTSFSISFWWR